jgi:transcriptional regulator with XRE-family HTH domain
MDDSANLGRLIRESRLERGLSLGQLASKVGRSSSSVRRWERDEVAPAIGILPDLAEALDLDEAELQRLRPGATVIDADPATIGNESLVGPTAVGETVSNGTRITHDPVEPVSRPPTERRSGLISDLSQTIFGSKPSWIGWVRGFLTVAVLFVMLLVLFWALGELADALSEVLDSFDVGTAG